MIGFDLLCEISEYAKQHSNSSKSFYKTRNQMNGGNKIFYDCLNGKIAEFNLYFYLKDKGYTLKEPDLKIYDGKEKNYSSDLYVENKDIYLHVKSISIKAIELYGKSIVMQKNDPIVKNPKDNHYIVPMVQVDFLNYEVNSWINSCDANYQPTITYKPSKCAIYLK